MPISVDIDKDGTIRAVVAGMARGLDSRSQPTAITPDHVPACQNITTQGGYISGMDGSTLHIAGFVAPDSLNPTLLARYIPATGTATYVMGCQNGQVYVSADGGATWTSVRRGLTESATLWWSHGQIGDYLLIGNPTDGVYKYDGSNLLPLGAKLIADCDSGEAALWAGETADTTNVKEGSGAIYCESAGAQTSLVYTPATNFDAVTGLLAARDYETDKDPGTDYYHFKVMFSNTGTIDTTNTRVLLTDGDAETLNFPYTTWKSDRSGTAMPSPPVAGTWYDVYLLASDGTDSATFDATNIDTFTFSVDTSAGTLRMTIDDIYVTYAVTMPACQIVASWKNMAIGAQASDVYYSPAGAPDQFDTVDTSVNVVDANDGTVITGVALYREHLLVCKENSLHVITVSFRNLTYPDYDFTLTPLRNVGHGCSSHRSLVDVDGAIAMWWRKAIYVFKGIGSQYFSEIVSPTVEDVAEDYLYQIVGAKLSDEKQVYWWYPGVGDTTNVNCLAYNWVQKAWLPVSGQTMALAETVYESNTEYLLTAGYTGRVLAQNTGTTWDGTAITRSITLPWIAAGPPYHVVSWKFLNVLYEIQASGSLILEARTASHPKYFDAASYSTVKTIDMTTTNTDDGEIKPALRAKWVQFRFRSVGAQFKLYWPFYLEGSVQGAH